MKRLHESDKPPENEWTTAADNELLIISGLLLFSIIDNNKDLEINVLNCNNWFVSRFHEKPLRVMLDVCSWHSDDEHSNNYHLACWDLDCTNQARPGQVRSVRRCHQQRRTRSGWSSPATPSPWPTPSRSWWRARSLQPKSMFPKLKHPLVKQVRISVPGFVPRKRNYFILMYLIVESLQIRQRSKSPNPVKDKGL